MHVRKLCTLSHAAEHEPVEAIMHNAAAALAPAALPRAQEMNRRPTLRVCASSSGILPEKAGVVLKRGRMWLVDALMPNGGIALLALRWGTGPRALYVYYLRAVEDGMSRASAGR